MNYESLEYSQLQKVLAPKVVGTTNLHEATLHQPLDFFTMTSSIITAIGTATQASYSAANSFQDAFSRFRVGQGLPAQSLALGMILDVGFASSREDIQRSLVQNGVYGTTELDLVRLLENAFTAQLVLDERFDLLAGAHLLAGREPSKIYEIDKKDASTDFAWSSDPRFGRITQALEDHGTVRHTTSNAHYSAASGSAPALSSLFSFAQSVNGSLTPPTPEQEQKL